VTPLEEAILPPLFAWLLALGGPLLARAILRRVAETHRRGLLLAGAGFTVAAYLAGEHALGPRFVPADDVWLGALFVSVTLLFCTGATLRLAARTHGSDPRTTALGLSLGVLACTGVLGAQLGTRLDDAASTSPSRARWRLRVDPWDGDAMLALAWASRHADDLLESRERAERAHEMSASEAAYWELRAELHAAEGECPAARDAFDRALRARAASAFEDDALLSATLGDYALPETLVTQCGLTDP